MSQLGADGGAIGGAGLIYQELFQVPRSHEDGLAAAFAGGLLRETGSPSRWSVTRAIQTNRDVQPTPVSRLGREDPETMNRNRTDPRWHCRD
jgi:hypothetical protein